jgi:hypothetical protein
MQRGVLQSVVLGAFRQPPLWLGNWGLGDAADEADAHTFRYGRSRQAFPLDYFTLQRGRRRDAWLGFRLHLGRGAFLTVLRLSTIQPVLHIPLVSSP